MAAVSGRSSALSGRIARSGEGPASSANIANIITVVRIFMAPLFVWLLLADDGDMGTARWVAASVFVVAILTDSLDGMLARRLNLVTDLGKILDPIADKVLIGAALVALSMLGEVYWWVTVVILVREFGITVFRFVVLRSRVIPASAGGKVKTVLQSVSLSAYLFPISSLVGDWFAWVSGGLLALTVIVTVVTGLDYLWKAYRFNRSPVEP